VTGREPIRSYQRIFRPDRRLHHIEGRALPVPGGVPLRWIGYVGAALFAVLALGTGSLLVYGTLAGGAALAGAVLGGREGAVAAAVGTFAGCWVVGHVLGALDWPIRLVIVPAAVAVIGTQATPDGRSAHRFAGAWLAVRLSPRRRSLGRALPAEGAVRVEDAAVWVSPDQHSPVLRRARIRGAGELAFAAVVSARRSRLRQGRVRVSPPKDRPERGGEVRTTRLAVARGEKVEVRS
jgi:hypothetical protein